VCKNILIPFCKVLQKAAPTSDKIFVPNLSGQLPLRKPVFFLNLPLKKIFSKAEDFSHGKKIS
jgi:hypothetical protein